MQRTTWSDWRGLIVNNRISSTPIRGEYSLESPFEVFLWDEAITSKHSDVVRGSLERHTSDGPRRHQCGVDLDAVCALHNLYPVIQLSELITTILITASQLI